MEQKLLSTDRPISVSYVFISEILYYVKKSDSECQVYLVQNSNWKLINTTIGSINLSEKPVETEAGLKFVTELSAIIPGHSVTTPGEVLAVTGRKVALKFVYRNGLTKIVGTNLSGPKLNISISAGVTTQRTLSAAWEASNPNLFIGDGDSGSGGVGV